MGSNSFILFSDLQDPVKLLSDEEAGVLFKSIFEYRNGGLKKELTGATKIAFMFIKLQLDRSEEHYQMICERNRANGAKGGRPKSKTSNKSKPTGLSGNPTEPNITLPDPYPDPKSESKKEEKSVLSFEKEEYQELAKLILTLHKVVDSKFKKTKEQLNKWAIDIRKLVEIDQRSLEEVEDVIRWAKDPDCFWFPNIQSGKKLREKFSTLYTQAKKNSTRVSPETEATLERLVAKGLL